MHQGTPEARLWAAVVLTLINDCRDELATATSLECIATAAIRWRNRAREPSFRMILDILNLDVSKVIKWIVRFEDRSRKAFLNGSWVHEETAFLEDDFGVIGRGQKRAY